MSSMLGISQQSTGCRQMCGKTDILRQRKKNRYCSCGKFYRRDSGIRVWELMKDV